MRKHLLLLLATLGLLLAACCNTPQVRMRAADAIIEADPDSALALLHAIDPADLTSATDSAYYALLLTQACIKTDTQPASDTLISRALAAYRFSPDPSLRTRAHFYAAQVAYRQRKYRDAMKNAVVAFDVASQTNDSYWIAKTAELLGDLYTHVFNYDLAQRFTRIAAEQYLKAGYERNHRFALCDLASNYAARGSFDSAFVLVDSVIEVARTNVPADSSLCSYGSEVIMKIRWLMDDYEGLDESLKAVNKNGVDHTNLLVYSIMESCGASESGNAEAFDNHLDNAYALVENDQDLVAVLYAEYRNAVSVGDYENAVNLSDSIIQLQSAVADELLDESLTSIQSDYYASQNSLRKQKNDSLRLLLVVILVSVTLLLLLIVSVFKLRLRAIKAEIKYNLANIQILKAQSESNAKLIGSMFDDKWNVVNKLCDALYDKSGSAEMHKYIIKDIESELALLGTPESIRDILCLTDSCKNGAISRLRNECPFLKENDIEFLGLICSGLSVRAVCYFMGIKYDTFYKKKNRLLHRIEESDTPHKEEFLSQFSKRSV